MLSIVVRSPTPGKPETWPNLVFVGLLKSLAGGLGCTSSWRVDFLGLAVPSCRSWCSESRTLGHLVVQLHAQESWSRQMARARTASPATCLNQREGLLFRKDGGQGTHHSPHPT